MSIPRRGACLPPAPSRALRAWIDLAPLSDEPLSRPVVRHRCPRCLGEQRWGGRVREYVRRTGDLYFAHQSSTREQENTLVRAALLAYSARKKRKKWSARVHSAAIFLNVSYQKHKRGMVPRSGAFGAVDAGLRHDRMPVNPYTDLGV